MKRTQTFIVELATKLTVDGILIDLTYKRRMKWHWFRYPRLVKYSCCQTKSMMIAFHVVRHVVDTLAQNVVIFNIWEKPTKSHYPFRILISLPMKTIPTSIVRRVKSIRSVEALLITTWEEHIKWYWQEESIPIMIVNKYLFINKKKSL